VADRPWLVFFLVFIVLPAIAIVADLFYFSKTFWTIPWLTFLALVWIGIGIVVGIGFMPEPDDHKA
jgi:hypothetical protein